MHCNANPTRLPCPRPDRPHFHTRHSITAEGGNPMSRSSNRNTVPSWKLWAMLAISLAFAGCAQSGADAGKVKKQDPDEPRKVGTGRSFAAETRVDLEAAPAAAPGWFSEAAASGQDDWEPAVAVDPGNANFVYHLITRYTGPKPCGNCKLPAIILRRSTNGGATWLPDQWLQLTTKAQYDPQIKVDINGNVHAAFLNGTTPGSTYLKSTDHGATWPTSIDWGGQGAKPQWNDHPWLGVSRDGMHVYVGFNSSDSYVVVSHTGGSSFSTPVKMNT